MKNTSTGLRQPKATSVPDKLWHRYQACSEGREIPHIQATCLMHKGITFTKITCFFWILRFISPETQSDEAVWKTPDLYEEGYKNFLHHLPLISLKITYR